MRSPFPARRICLDPDAFEVQIGEELVRAFTPEDDVTKGLESHGLEWRYPFEDGLVAFEPFTGLSLPAYRTPHPDRRIACFLSHFREWKRIAIEGETGLILEDDADVFDLEALLEVHAALEAPPPGHRRAPMQFHIVGVNDPRGATRLADRYHGAVKTAAGLTCAPVIVAAPWIDYAEIPQGLAGGSAYFMTPWGARLAMKAAHDYGAWPNDALLCKQLLPGILGQAVRYGTTVSGRESTLA